MTVRARQDLGIFHTSRSYAVVIDLLVEGTATLHDVAIGVALLLKLVEDGHVAVVGPIAFITVVEIFDVLDLVVTHKGVARCL